ncbi:MULTISPECIES: membrane protein insertion efficiency factor YidD [Parachlamydia]|jgi:putative component of membrane protein insertase Oxa1/YidC/SpoIIIJ protein YidD|uniref:Membrane protein insertion efficiency factor n=2 Tax=Parachlamydia acanthamoebae TaxID=83552 RepID=F8KX57_PARAV|nr:membrane protein insertion efficiency factor YidD [Parachlamydia acanthamoebae]EFB41545.1 hypothetical protein pah_c029o052 [Parachlamydia acanthamoebae str. Hall's coccus]KIA78732.1 hypothetical protein DB43_DL00020 [Parachlamydia acanthamoebae]CCB85524.1 putative uncharacterized protein [Parachlamydia acanthamoebae UV-7]
MTRLFALLLGLVISSFLHANPWGKDADLARKQIIRPPSVACKTPLLGYVGEKVIQFHQEVISPADGPRSNFIPSSSQYMQQAMRKYGFFQGFAMGCDRLMRENDDEWVYPTTKNSAGNVMKWDPVP